QASGCSRHTSMSSSARASTDSASMPSSSETIPQLGARPYTLLRGGNRIVRQRKPHPSISEDQALANARPLGSVQEVKPVEHQPSSLIGETVPAVRSDKSPT